MRKRSKANNDTSIDELVIAEAEHDAAWDKPVKVSKSKGTSLSIPADVALRAAFFARLHRESSVETWIRKILRERIDIEEAAFAETKRDLAPH